MTKRKPLLAAFSAALNALAGGFQLVLPAGEFSARDGRGPYRTGDLASLERIVAATRAYHDQTDMVVDYDHQSMAVLSGEANAGARAAGWVRQIEARPTGIWADIEWTEAAAAAVAGREYRYLSPVFTHTEDGDVGLILSVALTNVPAMHLEAMASRISPFSIDRKPAMDKILAALGLAQGAGEDAALTALNAMLAANTAMAAALGLGATARPAEIQAALTALVGERTRLYEAAGLTVAARPDQAIAALTALRAAGAPDPTKWVPIELVTAMQADVNALKADTLGRDAEAAVTAAMTAGKIAPALKDWALALFKADRGAFDKFVGAAPSLTAQQLRTSAVPPAGDGTVALTAEQATAARLLGLDAKAYAATLTAERASAL